MDLILNKVPILCISRCTSLHVYNRIDTTQNNDKSYRDDFRLAFATETTDIYVHIYCTEILVWTYFSFDSRNMLNLFSPLILLSNSLDKTVARFLVTFGSSLTTVNFVSAADALQSLIFACYWVQIVQYQ